MRRHAHIGISLAEKLRVLLATKQADKSEGFVEKTYEGTTDNFFESTNANLRRVLQLDKKSDRFTKDLQRFGTRMGLIEVADDTIPGKRRNELLPLQKPYKRPCFDESNEQDLQRFGTGQGIINVSQNDCRKNKQRIFPTDFSKAAYADMMRKWTERTTDVYAANPFSEIYRDFPKVQITVRNTSPDERDVVLWGASRQNFSNPPLPTDVQDHAIVGLVSSGGDYPQGMAVNPANHYLYVANQLSGSITVLNSNNALVKTIQLEPAFPGLTSPTSITINTRSDSTTFGYAYVACSVSNTIAVIDMALNVVEMVKVGARPIAIAFNPVNLQVYAANLVSDSVSVIHAETLNNIPGTPLSAGDDPIGIGINPLNGNIYVANSLDNTISVYDSSNTPIAVIGGITQYPASITFNPANNYLYAVASQSDTVYQLDPLTHSIAASIPTGHNPYNAFFDTLNNYLYVQNRGDNSFTIIRPDNSTVNGLSFGTQNVGGVFNSYNNSIYISDTLNNTLNIIGYQDQSSTLLLDPEYYELREELKNSPAIVQHTKFVVSGPERLHTFRISKFSPTGKVRSSPLSFELFASPQSALNVAEVTELAGTIIDGKMNWQFRLPGLHTVSILIWYRQLEVRDILSPPDKPDKKASKA